MPKFFPKIEVRAKTFMYLLVSFGTFLLILFCFAFHEKKLQEIGYFTSLEKYRGALYRSFSQPTIEIGLLGKARGAVIKNAKKLVSLETEGQIFIVDKQTVGSYGAVDDIDISLLKPGWQNHKNKIVLKEKHTRRITIITSLENPDKYLIKDNKAAISLSEKQIYRSFRITLFLFFVMQSIFVLLRYIHKAQEKKKKIIHDLKHSLGDAKTLAKDLSEASEDPEKIKELSRKILNTAMVRDSYTKPGCIETINLKASLEMLLDSFFYGGARDKSFFSYTPPSPGLMVGPLNQKFLHRALYNLLLNALKESQKKGHKFFNLTVLENADSAQILVTNTASLTDKKAKEIFSNGFSTHNSTGLGLSIVSESLEKIGAELNVLLIGNNKAAFSFTLPVERRATCAANSY